LLVEKATKELGIKVDLLATKVFESYLSCFSFYNNVYLKKEELFQQNKISNGRIPWVLLDELAEIDSDPNKDRIGVPQGGALSCLIANIILDSVDRLIMRADDSRLFYARFCDDMVLMHIDNDECNKIFDIYQSGLKEVKLISHQPKTFNAYGSEFWSSSLKSKAPYKWAEYKKGDENLIKNVPWVSFVGYQIRYDGLIRIRKTSIEKELKKQVTETAKIINSLKSVGSSNISRKAVVFRLQQRLISMAVGRMQLNNQSLKLCWTAGFNEIRNNPNIKYQFKKLDRNRERQLKRLSNFLKQIESPNITPKKSVPRLKYYGSKYSYCEQFIKRDSMKILHTSDWHLGKRLEDFSRIEEQQAVLQEICEIADREKVDAVLVAGDLFDTFNPPTEAVDLFYKTLKHLSNNGRRPVIAIAGNHDSPDRIEAPDPLARECGIIFAGYPNSVVPPFELESGLKVLQSEEGFLELQLPGTSIPLRLLLTPYANEFRLKTYLGHENSEEELRTVLQEKWQELAEKYCDNKGVNLQVTHLFVVKKGEELPDEPADEKPILHVGGAQVIYTENIPPQIQYTAIGHLHRMHQVDSVPCPVYYSGSPLSYSFAEANQQKYVLLVDTEPGKLVTVSEVELIKGKKLLRKRAEGMDEALLWLTGNPACLVELTMVTDTYLTAQERKQLSAAHNGIVTLIPEVRNANEHQLGSKKGIDLTRNMEELFTDYFRHEKGQDPNEEIMKLFTEILAEDDE